MRWQQNTEPAAAELATVGAKYTDGLSLIFDGQTQETAKHYKCNTDITYVVEYVVGNPK